MFKKIPKIYLSKIKFTRIKLLHITKKMNQIRKL